MHLKSVLPEEIILEIFSKIEQDELKKLLEISQEWRDLLIKNVEVMRKLPLILMNETWREKIRFVQNYGKYIREVKFVDTEIESFEEMETILRLTPNIEKLSLLRVKLPEKEENSEENPEDENVEESFICEKIKLKKLCKLSVEDETNVGSLNFIATNCEAVKLTSLKCDVNSKDQQKIVERILTDNRQLKSLEIATTLDALFDPDDEIIEQFTCRLEKISFTSIVMHYNEQFVKFLKSQKRVKELGILGSHVDFRYHQMMFTTFPSVRKICLNIDAISTTDCLVKIKKTPANRSIQSLTLMGRNLHLNVFDSILRLCPKIHHLEIENLTQFYSNKIRILPLTHLKVDFGRTENLKPENFSQSTKIEMIENLQSAYERNLQSYCDLNCVVKKNREILEAF